MTDLEREYCESGKRVRSHLYWLHDLLRKAWIESDYMESLSYESKYRDQKIQTVGGLISEIPQMVEELTKEWTRFLELKQETENNDRQAKTSDGDVSFVKAH